MNGIHPPPLSTETIFSVGIPLEHPRADDVDDDLGVADEEQRSADGELCVVVVGLPRVRAEVADRGGAGGDMEVHRHVQRTADLPERIPLAVREIGRALVLGVRRHVHAAQPEPRGAFGLGNARVHVPRRHHRERQEPGVRHLLHFGVVVIEHLQQQKAVCLVRDGVRELVAADAECIRKHDLRGDPHLVEQLDASQRIARGRVTLADVPIAAEDIDERDLVVVLVDHTRHRAPC